MHNILEHLTVQKEPLTVHRRASAPGWSDKDFHQFEFSSSAELYALLAVAPDLNQWQRGRILFQLLRSSRKEMSIDTRATLETVVTTLLGLLPTEYVITVFLALRKERINHKHSSRAILNYFAGHPHRVTLINARRKAVADCLEHALGKNVARTATKPAYSIERQRLIRYLKRLTSDVSTALQMLEAVYAKPQLTTELPAVDYVGLLAEYHQDCVQLIDTASANPKTVTSTNRGDIAAVLVHMYRGTESLPDQDSYLERRLDDYIKEAASRLPRFNGRLALVLDVSISSRGYGDREYSILSQIVALQKVLQERCVHLATFWTGAENGDLPVPNGTADLAGRLLDALSEDPDLVMIVSDGYENYFAGDLQLVVSRLNAFGIDTPIVFCNAKFSAADDLSLRRPINDVAELSFWHQSEFERLLLLSFMNADSGRSSVHSFLAEKAAWLNAQLRARAATKIDLRPA